MPGCPADSVLLCSAYRTQSNPNLTLLGLILSKVTRESQAQLVTLLKASQFRRFSDLPTRATLGSTLASDFCQASYLRYLNEWNVIEPHGPCPAAGRASLPNALASGRSALASLV